MTDRDIELILLPQRAQRISRLICRWYLNDHIRSRDFFDENKEDLLLLAHKYKDEIDKHANGLKPLFNRDPEIQKMRQKYILNEQEFDNASLDSRMGFLADGHRYVNVEEPSRRYTSVTGLIKNYKEPFDADAKAQEVVANPKSKYFGRDWIEVASEWKALGTKASNEGTSLHEYGEYLLNEEEPPYIPDNPKAQYVPLVVQHLWDEGYFVAKTELLVYSDVLRLAGQSDILLKREDVEDYYAIYDWKFLSKALQKKSYYNRKERMYTKLSGPFKYLDDCNWIHYSIQTAIYQTLTGSPELVKEKVLIVINDDGYKLEPCYPMRVFWDEDDQLQAVYEVWNKKWYDSRIDRLVKEKPEDIMGI